MSTRKPFEMCYRKGNILYDAQIVAVCREHGVREIFSEDRDFSRFEGVTLHTL